MFLVFFLYGLSFFIMGVVIALEVGRCSEARLRFALRFLAVFGLLHGAHEWLEMFSSLGLIPARQETIIQWLAFRIILLAISFLSLATFGAMLLVSERRHRRYMLMVPLVLCALWSFGVLYFLGRYTLLGGLASVLDVWTRYVIAIPASILACSGLVYQQREFRRVGMAQFGRDSLWAAVAFAWYGLIGQIFTTPSALPPSTFLNSDLFFHIFGFPIQVMRAAAAVFATIFVIRFLRSFEVEIQHMIAGLQAAQLDEAQRKEAQRGELLRRVVAAQEAERQRIARELHDETGQALTALGLGLRGIANQFRQDQDKATQNLRQLERMVGRSMDELQRIIGDLRPSHLDDLGLAAAIRWYCNDIQNRTSLQIALDIQGESADIPAEVKTAIFRIAQEALTNVIRHAQASQVNVVLCFQPDAVRLFISDNGKGFDSEQMQQSKRPSWGLLGMEERATLLDGSLTIQSQPKLGTRIEVIIPYHSFQKQEVDHANPATPGG
jgi:signal transduction histidine kinase